MIQACHRPIPNCHWLRPRKSCINSHPYAIMRQSMRLHRWWHLISHSRGKPLSLCTMNSRAVSFTALFSDLGASLLEWSSWFPLIMEYSGIGYLWWKLYADSTLNHMVSGEAYTRATKRHLQGTITSNTIMTSMVLSTAVMSFLTGVESSDIRDTEIIASYWEGPEMPVSTIATEKSAWRSRMWKERI